MAADDADAARGGVYPNYDVVAFTAETRMSGIDLHDGQSDVEYRRGAADAVTRWIGGSVPEVVTDRVAEISQGGGTPLLVAVHDADVARILGTVQLSDVVKPGMRSRFA